jgi:Integrase core domain
VAEATVQNAYVESFNGKVRDELLDVEEFACLAEARVVIEDWREDYNQRRPHSSLGMRSPAAFAAALRASAALDRIGTERDRLATQDLVVDVLSSITASSEAETAARRRKRQSPLPHASLSRRSLGHGSTRLARQYRHGRRPAVSDLATMRRPVCWETDSVHRAGACSVRTMLKRNKHAGALRQFLGRANARTVKGAALLKGPVMPLGLRG